MKDLSIVKAMISLKTSTRSAISIESVMILKIMPGVKGSYVVHDVDRGALDISRCQASLSGHIYLYCIV